MPKTPEEVAPLLIAIYRKGFNIKGTYRISRSSLRDMPLFDMARLEGTTIQQLHDCLREEGYLLTPLDQDDFSSARMWVVQRLGHLENRPLADENIIASVTDEQEE
jgi:hypothetical protein